MVEEITSSYKYKKIWTTYDGVQIKFTDLDHLHLI